MVGIKDWNIPSKCQKCSLETYDWETGEHSYLINGLVTEDLRETERSKYCPLVEIKINN